MLPWHLPPFCHGPELGPALLLQAWPSKQDSAAAHSRSGSACLPPMGVAQTGLAEARPRTSTSVERDGEGFTYGPRDGGPQLAGVALTESMFAPFTVLPPCTLTLSIRGILHVVACEVELTLCHRVLWVGFQEH